MRIKMQWRQIGMNNLPNGRASRKHSYEITVAFLQRVPVANVAAQRTIEFHKYLEFVIFLRQLWSIGWQNPSNNFL